MFTKALIVDIPNEGDNYYKIRLPLFEDTTGEEVYYNALCCHAPGVFGGLNKGDCVYVAFEDAKLNIPVIIGRLYITEKDEYSKGLFNNLNVVNTATLPINTTFGDGLNIKNLYNTVQYLSAQEGQCPYAIGDIYISSTNNNPDLKWQGTTWTDFGITTTSTGNTIYNWRRDS